MMDENVTLLDDRFVDGLMGADAEACEVRSMGATLASVEQYDFRVSPQTPASVMYAQFQRDPLLPGGIVADGETVVGLLSRQRFFQQLSHRFGASLFLDAPVQKILATAPGGYLALAEETGIHEAAGRCLARPRDLVFEPILVVRGDRADSTLGHARIAPGAVAPVDAGPRYDPGANRGCRGCQPGQEQLPGQHEPRNPHAFERHRGHDGTVCLDSSLARQREYAGTVIDSCENLLAIINDVLDFSKIESGRFQLERLALRPPRTSG